MGSIPVARISAPHLHDAEQLSKTRNSFLLPIKCHTTLLVLAVSILAMWCSLSSIP